MIAAQEVIICLPTRRGLCKRPMRFRIVDVYGQPGRNHACDFILNRKRIAQRSVKSICPQVRPPRSVDQLRCDANGTVAALDTSFENVTRIEFAADLSNVDASSLVLKRRIPRDHEQLGKSRKLGDDVFGDAFAEIILIWISREVDESQNRNRGKIGRRSRRLGHPPCHHATPVPRADSRASAAS